MNTKIFTGIGLSLLIVVIVGFIILTIIGGNLNIKELSVSILKENIKYSLKK